MSNITTLPTSHDRAQIEQIALTVDAVLEQRSGEKAALIEENARLKKLNDSLLNTCAKWEKKYADKPANSDLKDESFDMDDSFDLGTVEKWELKMTDKQVARLSRLTTLNLVLSIIMLGLTATLIYNLS